MMRLLFSDGRLMEKGGRLRLVRCHTQWYVVSEGYVSQVAGSNEGMDLIKRLTAEGTKRGVSITMGS